MIFSLVPEYCFSDFSEASAAFLTSIGVRGILLDIDNTLEPYENPLPGEEVLRWFASLRAAGIAAAIVSNNGERRVTLFNSVLGIPAYSKAKKPWRRNLLRAMADMGVSPEQTVLMGDQIFTDVWAAHNAGVRAILVPPIRDRRDVLTRCKRWLERPILRRYRKLHSVKKEEETK